MGRENVSIHLRTHVWYGRRPEVWEHRHLITLCQVPWYGFHDKTVMNLCLVFKVYVGSGSQGQWLCKNLFFKVNWLFGCFTLGFIKTGVFGGNGSWILEAKHRTLSFFPFANGAFNFCPLSINGSSLLRTSPDSNGWQKTFLRKGIVLNNPSVSPQNFCPPSVFEWNHKELQKKTTRLLYTCDHCWQKNLTQTIFFRKWLM